MDSSSQLKISALLSRKEVAERVKCHPRSIARAERRGELKGIKFNSRLVRYDPTEVDAWIQQAKSNK